MVRWALFAKVGQRRTERPKRGDHAIDAQGPPWTSDGVASEQAWQDAAAVAATVMASSVFWVGAVLVATVAFGFAKASD